MDKDEKRMKRKWVIVVGIVLLLLGIAIWLYYLMQGKTTTTGNYPEDVKSITLACEAKDMLYPIYSHDNSKEKEINVRIAFTNDKMSSMSLTSKLYYEDDRSAELSETYNHGSMNKKFGADGLGADAFSANYSKTNNKMIMTLYMTSGEYNSVSGKYFLINDVKKDAPISEFEDNYESQGFTCEVAD